MQREEDERSAFVSIYKCFVESTFAHRFDLAAKQRLVCQVSLDCSASNHLGSSPYRVLATYPLSTKSLLHVSHKVEHLWSSSISWYVQVACVDPYKLVE